MDPLHRRVRSVLVRGPLLVFDLLVVCAYHLRRLVLRIDCTLLQSRQVQVRTVLRILRLGQVALPRRNLLRLVLAIPQVPHVLDLLALRRTQEDGIRVDVCNLKLTHFWESGLAVDGGQGRMFVCAVLDRLVEVRRQLPHEFSIFIIGVNNLLGRLLVTH